MVADHSNPHGLLFFSFLFFSFLFLIIMKIRGKKKRNTKEWGKGFYQVLQGKVTARVLLGAPSN